MNADQVTELLEYVHHIAGILDAMGILLCFWLGVITALLVNSRR